jgi:putative ABC transport system permease protein
MIKTYLKIAWRNLVKNKVHTFINVVGLSLGMAVVVLISLWIYDEMSYDKYFKNYDRIVQVMQHQTINHNTITQVDIPIPLGAKLRQDYNQDFKYIVLSTYTDQHIISHGDKKLNQSGKFMQVKAPDLLSLKMIKGTRAGLADPSSIMLSASLAKAIFGNADPIDQLIKIDNTLNVKVTGIYEDMPQNTSFNDVAFIAPWDLFMTSIPYLKRAATQWGNNSWELFAQMKAGVDVNKVSADIKYAKKKSILAQGDKGGASFNPVLFLNPMSRWHLYSAYYNGVNIGGKIDFVWMFGIIGLFVLILACINFMNLSTARSEKRAKEVGVRKTLGSDRKQLIAQFYTESLLMSSLAFIVSILLVQLAFPWFNQIAGKQLVILWASPIFWLITISFSLLTGIMAGSYPALYLSSFKPIKVLKGTFNAGPYASLPRKVLVVLQFTVSITLIIGTVIIFRQVQFTKNRPVGYGREGLIQAQLRTGIIHEHLDAIKYDLLKLGAITNIAESNSPLTGLWQRESGLSWRNKPAELQDDFGIIPVSFDFGKTVNWKIIDGRDFSKEFATDSLGMILNESAAKFMNFTHPVGEAVKKDGRDYKIIGVVKDLVMASPYERVTPTIFNIIDFPGNVVSVRINPNISTHDAIAKISTIFKQYDPDSPFDYQFTDSEYAKKFDDEERTGKLASFFTILAIFISCLGLFGMASFMAEQRTKEIGIRKVLGASVFSLWQLISKEFVLLVTISIVLATPAAYYFMNNWIRHYYYRVPLSWWIFAVTAASAIIITLITVSYQGIKSALTNPVKSLRSE